MQPNKGYEIITRELCSAIRTYFNERIGTIVISRQTDAPYTEFRMEFDVYKFFDIVLDYDRGRIGCAILNGSMLLQLENSQKWYEDADIALFLKELDEQIRLRIPEKYLEHYNWK